MSKTHKQEALYSYKKYKAYQPLTTYWWKPTRSCRQRFRKQIGQYSRPAACLSTGPAMRGEGCQTYREIRAADDRLLKDLGERAACGILLRSTSEASQLANRLPE